MNEQLKKYLKTFRQSLRGMGLEVLPPKGDGMIIARNKADRLFDEYAVYDFRKEQPDDTVKLTMMFSNMRYFVPQFSENQCKVAVEFSEEIRRYNRENGFTRGEHGEFMLVRDDMEGSMGSRIVCYYDLELSPIVLSPKYTGPDELGKMSERFSAEYNEHAKKLYGIWLELGQKSVAERNGDNDEEESEESEESEEIK